MHHFHDQSKVWIYLANRPFTESETGSINQAITSFCKEWSAHGTNLKAAGEIRFNQFIILMVDETAAGASGCSIDKSVRFIQSLERTYDVQLFNRLLIAIKEEKEIKLIPLNDFQELIKSGAIHATTLVFNNAVTTKGEMNNTWLLPLKDSWLGARLSVAV